MRSGINSKIKLTTAIKKDMIDITESIATHTLRLDRYFALILFSCDLSVSSFPQKPKGFSRVSAVNLLSFLRSTSCAFFSPILDLISFPYPKFRSIEISFSSKVSVFFSSPRGRCVSATDFLSAIAEAFFSIPKDGIISCRGSSV